MSAPARLGAQVLRSLLEIRSRAHEEDEQRIAQRCVEAAERLTRSRYAYLHFVNEDQATMELGCWSRSTLHACQAVFDRHYPVASAGAWAECIRSRAPRIHNRLRSTPAARDYPQGHVPLHRHLGVPLVEEGAVRLMIGVANKAADYDAGDVRTVRAVVETAWSVIVQRRALERLLRNEQRMQEAQSIASITGWEWDREEGVLRLDRDFARLLGSAQRLAQPPSTLEGFLGFIAPEDQARLRGLLCADPPEEEFQLEVRARTVDDEARYLLLKGRTRARSRGRGVLLHGVLQDVTEQRQLLIFRHQALHDPLTGLANRHQLDQFLERIRDLRRAEEDAFALHYIDLDRFKSANDRFGHAVGDEVLKVVAGRLLGLTRKRDLVVRFGGDEFIVLQRGVRHRDGARTLARKIVAALSAGVRAGAQQVAVGASIGVVMSAEHDGSAEEMLARGDALMYRSKARGGNRVSFDGDPA